MDALIVAVQMQDEVLQSKKTWTRKITIVTDGESPMELEDWEATVQKINELEVRLAVVYVPFCLSGLHCIWHVLIAFLVALTLTPKNTATTRRTSHTSR